MAGIFSNLLGLGGNNGTEHAFNNQYRGEQDFSEAEFHTGAQVTARGGSIPSHRNNGTRQAFNNSAGGKQNFAKAKFTTGAKAGN
ncbi:hypothetical protein SESBI_32596 [Sesbania bispinosa]|nr:hypothetical protein SESBI_32596 [Sesbania bispinosa]